MKSKIYIIGMGPGKEEMMTGEAIQALENSDVIIGYTVYVKLLGERFEGKPSFGKRAALRDAASRHFKHRGYKLRRA